ncbi:MAG: metallophosphoesterase [Spirochaetes bacterium]|jgi:predicted MPP superfamily phosphohydrolase|nr:metallophosphoesterase [Spirochaetota bacterium]
MKVNAFLIFFSVFMIVYASANFYIYRRLKQLLLLYGKSLNIFRICFILLAGSYILARFLESLFQNGFTSLLVIIGSFYLAIMLYMFLILLCGDLTRLVIKHISLTARLYLKYKEKFRPWFAGLLIGSIALITIYGYHHACSPVMKYHRITSSKPGLQNPVRIAFVSDIHLGTIIKNSRLARMITLINGQSPDIILLGGDIIDEDIAPVIENDMGALLTVLKAPLGVFGVTGNHEYIGGVDAAVDYLETHGVTMIRDSALLFPDNFILVGREDFSINRFSDKSRKSLKKIIDTETDPGDIARLPIIVVDHQPKAAQEAIESNVDLMLSGHTHNGQLWPVKHIVAQIFKIRHGLKKFDNTNLLVSSGYGTWGPPVRIATDSEIIIIDLFPSD